MLIKLTRKNIADLTEAIIKANDEKAKYIYNFANNTNGLTKKNIDDLTKAICKTQKDNIDDGEMNEFLNKVRFNYVDDNIEDYLKGVSKSKKTDHK